jgi:hypothetical protein
MRITGKKSSNGFKVVEVLAGKTLRTSQILALSASQNANCAMMPARKEGRAGGQHRSAPKSAKRGFSGTPNVDPLLRNAALMWAFLVILIHGAFDVTLRTAPRLRP